MTRRNPRWAVRSWTTWRNWPGSAANRRRQLALSPLCYSQRRRIYGGLAPVPNFAMTIPRTAVFMPLALAAAASAQDCSWSYLGEAAPGPRVAHSMIFDQARGEAVMFGGWVMLELSGDTWTWDGAQWHFRTSEGPGPR